MVQREPRQLEVTSKSFLQLPDNDTVNIFRRQVFSLIISLKKRLNRLFAVRRYEFA